MYLRFRTGLRVQLDAHTHQEVDDRLSRFAHETDDLRAHLQEKHHDTDDNKGHPVSFKHRCGGLDNRQYTEESSNSVNDQHRLTVAESSSRKQ